MSTLLFFIGWCILFAISWPLAILALFLLPIVWLISLPFKVLGIGFTALFALITAIVMLPARCLGHRG